MKVEKILIEAEGGQAVLTAYIREEIEARKGRKRPGVIICPGGGYERCSDRESEPVAAQFLAMGLHCFVLEYSTAPAVFPTALIQLAKAVAYIRSHKDEMELDENKILVCGFSAGGHLAASLGTFWNKKEIYEGAGEKSGEAIRPDRLILCYPVVTSGPYGHQESFRNLLGRDYKNEEKRNLVSLEKQAGAQTPPVFLWHTDEDKVVPAENSLLLAMALRKAGVSLEYHLFPEGRHGLSVASEDSAKEGEGYVVLCCQQWIPLVKEWMREWKAY